MVLATVLAIAVTAARWYLWRRGRRTAGDPGWPVPAAGTARAGTARRSRAGGETKAEYGYPAGFAGPGGPREGGDTGGPGVWGDAGSPGPGPRPGPSPGRPGSGPYNFSSGA
jgi:hypothetical protein